MSTILDKIIENKRREVQQQKEMCSTETLVNTIQSGNYTPQKNLFSNSLKNSSSGIIAEFKRRSPSKGWIFERAEIDQVIPFYSSAGAAAISVLTDMDFFGGNLDDLKLAASLTQTPLLRKDFVIDEYQLYQARIYGASAILLIASALSVTQTRELAIKARELQLDVLLEIHNEEELGHINEYVDVVGVNNRNLGTFVTDIQVSFELADKIPDEFVKISESGISLPQTVIELREAGFEGFLMGENFMKTSDPGKALEDFIQQLS